MRALVIEHDDVSPLGPIGDRMRERLYDLEMFRIPDEVIGAPGPDIEFPTIDDFDALVVLGAIYSVYDVGTHGRWVRPELELARAADRAGIPVLGICFGGQLLTTAHGGSVAKAPVGEIAWTSIETDDHTLVSPGPWFQWHFDRWQVPPGATEVARNARASQAWTMRRNLAVQFHPEVTAASLHGWYETGGDQEARAFGLDPDEVMAQTVAEEPAAVARAHALVDAFVDRVATR
ncbi:MAG: type 1 glutamine amidotransferase [Nocardioides sp.]|jgi:GMP synthase-like glutamine amidotransferase